jgi:hypothetical protein
MNFCVQVSSKFSNEMPDSVLLFVALWTIITGTVDRNGHSALVTSSTETLISGSDNTK